jgi:hypothetical protein
MGKVRERGKDGRREKTTERGKIRCLRMPPDRHPEPGFRWARAD